MATQLTSIVESSQAERLATGFVFTEGPLWHPDGHWLFVDVRANLIYRLRSGGHPEIIRDNSGSSNGMTFDLQGRLIICEGDNRQITRLEPDGTYTPLAQRLGGKRINRPNDLVTRSDGSIYFTDPGGRLTPQERELDFSGVHRIAPDGTLSNATAETARLVKEAEERAAAAERRASEALNEAAAHRQSAQSEADAHLTRARREAEQIVASARSQAESLNASANADAEREVAALKAEVERLTKRRDAIAAQLGALRDVVAGFNDEG